MENEIYPREISYYTREVYGTRMEYVARHVSDEMDKLADCILSLTGRKTLTSGDVAALIMMGYRFNQVLPPRV